MATALKNGSAELVLPTWTIDQIKNEPRIKKAWGNSHGVVRKAFGDFMQNVAHRKAAMSTVAGPTGGYLVPETLAFDLDSILQDMDVFHQLAWNLPMSSGQVGIPSYDVNRSHATGDSPLYGGMGLSWSVEGSALPEKAPTFAKSSLVAKNLYALVLASDQLVANGGEALGLFLERMFSYAISWSVERACFRGVVPNQPQGVIESPASVVVSRNAATDVKSVDLAKMVRSLLPACYNRAIWCYHPTVVEKVAQLVQYQISEPSCCGLVGTLLGRPAFVTEKLPALGTKGDIVLFDPTQYVLGHRQLEISAAPSIDTTYFNSQQTLYRLIWRGDGKFLAKGTITLEDNSTVVGVSVVLGT